MKVERVMERVWDRRRLRQAWKQMRKNAGAAGIDHMLVEEFAERQEELLELIGEKLRAGHYRFKSARRKLIAKEGTSKKRKLGIPTVVDRVVGLSVHLVLEEIFDPEFTTSNFGFRRGRSQHRTVDHARRSAIEGYGWCASIDFESFFDEIPPWSDPEVDPAQDS